ncbi:MAG: hypothetical protein Kapaf2KO_07940 [Candidatus Kapaibacteriales bacterium]
MANKTASKTPKKSAAKGEPTFWDRHKLDIIFIGLLVVGLMVFLGGAFFGGSVPASDNLASFAMQKYLESAQQSGEFPLWIPHIFSGMPSFASLLNTGDRWWDFIHKLFYGSAAVFGSIFNSDVARVSFFYIIYGVGMYLLMLSKGKDKFAAFFTSFAAVFSTGVIVWIMIGHNTKPIAMAMMPWIFMSLERLRQKFSLLYAVLLSIVLHITFESTHVQMIFYVGCAVGLYLIFELISRTIKKDNPGSVLRTAGVLVLAGVLAFLLSSDRYLAVLEYTDYSTRGSAPLVQDADASAAERTGGNDYDYATMWSFSPGETIDFLVPGYHGYGKLEYDYDDKELSGTGLGRVLKQSGNKRITTYWSQKPFEDVPPYMGIIVFAFAILGFWAFRKDVFMQFLLALSAFSLILSFGYTFPLLYDFFYHFVPSFNKFRAPSMVLALMQFAFPIAAGYAVDKFIKDRHANNIPNQQLEKYGKALLIGSGVFIGMFLVFAATFKTSFYSAIAESNNQIAKSQFLSDLQEFVWNMTIADWLINSIILVAASFVTFMFARKKLGYYPFIGIVGLLLVLDLFRVSGKALEIGESDQAIDQIKVHSDWAEYIKGQEGYFRIADFVSPTPNAAAYWDLHAIGGYHAAKLRVYQDMLDVAAGGSTNNVQNPFLWNLMGTKYLVAGQQIPGLRPVYQSQRTGAVVQENPNALPRVFFVDTWQTATEMEAAELLEFKPEGNFDPRAVAYITPGDSGFIGPKVVSVTGTGAKAEIVEFENQYIKIEAEATGDNLLFISEVWYPKGWTTYIDGERVDTYRTNFAFRSVIVPEGKHTVELKYVSEQFEFGRTVAMLSSGILIALLVIGFIFQRRNKEDDNHDDNLEKSE